MIDIARYWHITVGGAATTMAGWLGRLGWKTVQRDRKRIADIHEELTLQRTNCLNTIQAQGKEQVELLGEIRNQLNEQNGYIRGLVEGYELRLLRKPPSQ